MRHGPPRRTSLAGASGWLHCRDRARDHRVCAQALRDCRGECANGFTAARALSQRMTPLLAFVGHGNRRRLDQVVIKIPGQSIFSRPTFVSRSWGWTVSRRVVSAVKDSSAERLPAIRGSPRTTSYRPEALVEPASSWSRLRSLTKAALPRILIRPRPALPAILQSRPRTL